MVKEYRDRSYEPTQWEDQVIDKDTKEVLVDGTPVDEENLGNIETGLLLAHLDIGAALLMALQLANLNQKEIEKYKKQRFIQGQATITTSDSNGYFRDAEPFTQVSLDGFAQINAPNYDVLLTPVSGDVGLIGDLVAYDKTQNGFKVKMTGSAKSVTFLWTLLNPNV